MDMGYWRAVEDTFEALQIYYNYHNHKQADTPLLCKEKIKYWNRDEENIVKQHNEGLHFADQNHYEDILLPSNKDFLNN